MDKLISVIKSVMNKNKPLPFAVYSSVKEQHILNVPIVKPMLIVVLSGTKALGNNNDLVCNAGHFVFLSDSPSINMRNIPSKEAYFALLIEFEYEALSGIDLHAAKHKDFCVGQTTRLLEQCLTQFVESVSWAPESMWASRKREILALLCHMGYQDVLSMIRHAKIGYKIHDMFQQNTEHDLTVEVICRSLAMSESTLRRKLKGEGTSIQAIKDQAKLGLGLHLIQTTHFSVNLVAEKCGYQSQSRFTERFKNRFGLTPSALRKTRMTDSGEIMTFLD